MKTASSGFAARLQAARAATGRTQEDIARAIDIATPTISRLEHGREPKGIDVCEKLARELGVSFGWLVSGEGEPGANVRVKVRKAKKRGAA